MIEKVCLTVNDSYNESYICNEAYFDNIIKTKRGKSSVKYEILNNKLVSSMEDLIKYCLIYNVDIDIPEGYKVTKIYNIIFTTGNFDPDNREYSNCHSSIVYSSLDETYIKNKFKIMCNCVGKKNNVENYKHYFCWHTEDFADNQIIHAYNIDESFIVEKVEVE